YFTELPKDVADKWLAPIVAAERAAKEKRINEQQAATHNLALTETEIEQARSLVTGLNSRTDDIEGITWYSPDPADNYKTAVYLYIGQKQTGQPWLRWKIRHYGKD